MKTVTVSELRKNLKSILEEASNGVIVNVTQYGKSLVKLVSNKEPETEFDKMTLEEKMAYIKENVVLGDVLSPIEDVEWTYDQDNIGVELLD